MKKLHLWGILALLAFGLASCTDDNEADDPDRSFVTDPFAYTFRYDETGDCETLSLASIPAEVFADSIVGYGWKHLATYQIYADGTMAGEEFYANIYGLFPCTYYYKDDHILIEYPDGDSAAELCYPERSYEYQTDGNWILVDGCKDMQVLSVWGDYLYLLRHLADTGEGEHIFGYSCYRRLTESELLHYQNTYTTVPYRFR